MDALGHADAGLLLEEAGEISTVIAVFCSDLRGGERRVAVGADVFLHRDDHGGQRERSALPAIQKGGGQVEKAAGRQSAAAPFPQPPYPCGTIASDPRKAGENPCFPCRIPGKDVAVERAPLVQEPDRAYEIAAGVKGYGIFSKGIQAVHKRFSPI